MKIIEKENSKNIDAIYIHIPFCNKKCDYCDFCTFINMQKEYEKYVDYLIKEIRMYPKYKYDTIYFGGGTPSLLPIELIKRIMNELSWTDNAEITLELNPTDMTFEKLLELKKIGINRLSIGIQSFQNHVLKFIGREHNSKDATDTYKLARKAGFENITVDLMFGIPNQTLTDLQQDLKTIRELSPENVSIYSLIWEEGTIFWSKLQKGILSEIDQDLEAKMYEYIIDYLTENGYNHYEISNFCKKSENSELKYGRHNIKYWKNSEFIGVGMSAASYYDGKRYSDIRTFKKYYDAIERNEKPMDENTVEIVDEIEKQKLKNMLGLRLVKEGIPWFRDDKVDKLVKNGLLEIFSIEANSENDFEDILNVQKKIRLTRKGLLFANDVFVEFI